MAWMSKHHGFIEFLAPGWIQGIDKVWRQVPYEKRLRRRIARMVGIRFGMHFFGYIRAETIDD